MCCIDGWTTKQMDSVTRIFEKFISRCSKTEKNYLNYQTTNKTKTKKTTVVQSLSSSSFVDKVELIIRFHWLIDWHIIRGGKNQRSSSSSSTFSSKLILKNISNAFIHRWHIMIAINFFLLFSFHHISLFIFISNRNTHTKENSTEKMTKINHTHTYTQQMVTKLLLFLPSHHH